MPGRLAAEAARRGMMFVQISTDAVFDGSKKAYTEENMPSPINVYGRTKRLGELAVKSAHQQAIIVRSNFFGWSIAGSRSLAEFFINSLEQGRLANGFTDRSFCPLLANDFAAIILQMVGKGLRGIYHAVASDHVTKYEFGVAIAKRFGFDPQLIVPAATTAAKPAAPRSHNLVLANSHLSRSLGRRLPTVEEGIERLHNLYENGYRDRLRSLSAMPVAVKG
jgi:dTDP-4-dehydrorhamnose reductase